MHEPFLVVATLWWIVFSAAVGLTLGSYLNVVIYRIPRGISTSMPRWSFCPSCQNPIRWHDNLPVFSYVRLRGRCRTCGAVISPRYPLIELLTATVTLVVLDALCVARLRAGLFPGMLGLTEQLSHDWQIVLAHVVLFACLLGMSVIDLEHYFIDIRFTNFAVFLGFILHSLWTPIDSQAWLRPGATTSLVAIVVVIVLAITWFLLRLWVPLEGPPESADQQSAGNPTPSADAPAASGPATEPVVDTGAAGPAFEAAAPQTVIVEPARRGHLPPLVAGLVLAVLAVVMAIDALGPERAYGAEWRLLVPLVVLFIFIVGAGAAHRPSDVEIVSAIESERASARSVALHELLILSPAILCGIAALWLCLRSDSLVGWVSHWLGWTPVGHLRPILGLATAAAGFVIGGAMGWAVRIVFTLVLGREAFGMGDVHLMAAAGCVAGWPVVVLGFVLTCFLALAGWLAALPFKRTRAIPLVPWLSLSFLAVAVFLEAILDWTPVRNVISVVEMIQDISQAP